MAKQQPVLTLQQVARYLNVHRNTIYRLAQRGGIPAFKVGSDWRFNRESIDAWRVAQEKLITAQSAQADVAAIKLRTELLDLIEWYSAEALQSSVSLNDIRLFFPNNQFNQRVMPRELRRMVVEGLLELNGAGKEKRYRLTAAGLSQVRSVDGKFEKNQSGHGSFIRTSTDFFELKSGE